MSILWELLEALIVVFDKSIVNLNKYKVGSTLNTVISYQHF